MLFPPKSSSLSLLLLVFFSAIFIMADSTPSVVHPASSSADAAVHIVYTERPDGNEQPEAFHIRTLTSVLGSSDQAAKDALLYSYKTAASGFSAKLTPDQVEQMSKQPGVLQVVPSKTLQLHSGPGMLH
ncbi:Subtilisin-like protease SBT3.17 [Linum perenne]